MLLGALEITGFLAQHDSLEPLDLLGRPLAAPLLGTVFIPIMSFAYYRRPAKCLASPHYDSQPVLLLLSSLVLREPWLVGALGGSFSFASQLFSWVPPDGQAFV